MLKRAVIGAILLAIVPLAAARAAEHPRKHLTRAGQTAARAAEIARSDLGHDAVWTGGATTPKDGLKSSDCATFRPKRADLVLNGDAGSAFEDKASGTSFSTLAGVFATPEMVRLLAQRTFESPHLLECAATLAKSVLPATLRFVSVRHLPFTAVGEFTVAWRITLAARSSGQQLQIDQVAFGQGRTEIVLSSTYLTADAATVQPIEQRLVKVLVSRIRL
jgi:hypothetical protein